MKTKSKVRWPATLVAILSFTMAGCLQSPEAKRAAYLESGEKFLKARDYARAILEFKNALDLKPDDPETHYQLGLVYLATGDWILAAAHLKKATDLEPQFTGAQVRIAELMATTRDPSLLEEAHKRLLDVFRSSPDNVEALTALGVTEWKLARPEDAEKHLREAFTKAHPRNLAPAVSLARMKIEQKQYGEAEKVLQDAIGEPPSPEALTALGEFYVLRARLMDAEQLFERALAIDRNNALALLHLATLNVQSGNLSKADDLYRRVSRLPGKQYRPLHAVFLFQTGKKELAIAEFEKLMRENPGDRTARNYLVGALIWSDRLSEAEKLLTDALARDAGDVECLLQRSALYLTLQRYNAAERDLNRILYLKSDSAEADYLMAALHGARGQFLSQRQALDQALRIKPDFLAARVALSMLMIRQGWARTALQVIDETPQAQKRLLAVVIQRNWALMALRRFEEVEQSLKDLARVQSPGVAILASALRLEKKQLKEARTLAYQALAQQPDDVRALEILTRSYTEENNTPAAIRAIAAYASQRPNSAPVHYFLGSLLSSAGKRDEARAAFMRARTLRPGFIEADLSLVKLDISDGKQREAKDMLTKLLAERGENLSARLWLGNLEQMAGNTKAAIEHYRKALQSDAGNLSALNNLAFLLADSAGEPDQAFSYAQKAAELAPDNPAVCDTLGWVFYQKGLYKLAVHYLERAVATESTAQRNYHLSMAYLKAGDQLRGRKALETTLRLNPTGREAKLARELMAETQ